MHPILRTIIDATPSGHLTFLMTEFGKPFAVPRPRPHEIAAITGHASLKEIVRYTNTVDRKGLARAAR
jgi:hypothetical protein